MKFESENNFGWVLNRFLAKSTLGSLLPVKPLTTFISCPVSNLHLQLYINFVCKINKSDAVKRRKAYECTDAG